MTPVDWYFARGNKQMGPVSSADLKRLAVAGEIHPDDLVWREGLTEWALARSVRGLFDEEGHPAAEEVASQAAAAASNDAETANESAASRQRAPHLLDALLNSLRTHFNARFVEAAARIFRTCGLYGLLAAMVVAAAFSLIAAAKADAMENLLSGAVLLALLAAMQYAAGKSCDALDRLNGATGGSLASTALPDCLALLSLAAGLAALLGSVATAIQFSTYSAILLGIASLIVCGYSAVVLLNPTTLNIAIVSQEARPGEEGISVLIFLLKAMLRLAPAAFGVGVVGGTLLMGMACYHPFSGTDGLIVAQVEAAAARSVLISAAALPLAAYLLFLLGSLALDLCRAVLTLLNSRDKS
jgi:hypothetical protein